MTSLAIVQARHSSSRLPGKVLMPLRGKPILEHVVNRARRIPGVDRVVLATSTGAADDAVAGWAGKAGVDLWRGPEDDVLGRFIGAIDDAGLGDDDVVVRLTADCPVLDPMVAGMVVAAGGEAGIGYATNADPPSWPDGLDCEAVRAGALRAAAAEAVRTSDREHVTPFVRRNRDRFPARIIRCPLPGMSARRWTVDTAEDLDFLEALLATIDGGSDNAGFLELLAAEKDHPELAAIHRQLRNEGFARTLRAEPLRATAGFARSEAMKERAEKTVPLASQTFSKSYIQFPRRHAPLFLSHGSGGRVFDIDGNEYVDLISGLLPVVLGYHDPDVDEAVSRQLDAGISFSLSTKLEAELAERLCEIIPAAEMVRFGKNGSDATSATIRLARHFTGRDRVIACGYHGWHDWYIGATARHGGVPAAVRALTHLAPYNNLEAVETIFAEHPGEIAALIMEPMTGTEPKPGYLAALAELVRSHGALFIFDEVVTGFRFHLGGAQSLFGVTPDLAAFGKAMANGMPISAVVGRRDIMKGMEDVFISGTFGGEALSLAAAIATVDKMRREPVIERLWQRGGELAGATTQLIARHGLDKVIALAGKDVWKILSISDHPGARKEAIKTRLLIDLIGRGVLIAASHNLTYAHTADDIAVVLAAYDEAFGLLREALDAGGLEAALPTPAIEPVFRVRG